MAMMGCRGLRLRCWSGEAEGMVLNCEVGKKNKLKEVLMDGQRGRLKSVGEKDTQTLSSYIMEYSFFSLNTDL